TTVTSVDVATLAMMCSSRLWLLVTTIHGVVVVVKRARRGIDPRPAPASLAGDDSHHDCGDQAADYCVREDVVHDDSPVCDVHFVFLSVVVVGNSLALVAVVVKCTLGHGIQRPVRLAVQSAQRCITALVGDVRLHDTVVGVLVHGDDDLSGSPVAVGAALNPSVVLGHDVFLSVVVVGNNDTRCCQCCQACRCGTRTGMCATAAGGSIVHCGHCTRLLGVLLERVAQMLGYPFRPLFGREPELTVECGRGHRVCPRAGERRVIVGVPETLIPSE